MMPAAARKYGPVNKCIYCRTAVGVLGAEHVFPEGMDGKDILIAASCDDCGAIINREIEQPFMRRLLKDFRYKWGIGKHSRKKGKEKRPDALPLIVTRDGKDEKISVPCEKYPSHLVLPVMAPAGIACGLTREDSFKDWPRGFYVMNEADKELGSVTLRQEFNVVVFCRQLAKIAHGYAVAKYGLDGFKPFLPDIILGKDRSMESLSYLIGVTERDLGSTPMKGSWMYAQKSFLNENTFIMVLIQIFPHHGTPIYAVYAGEHVRDGLGLPRIQSEEKRAGEQLKSM